LSTPHDQILEKMYRHSGRSESALPLPGDLDVNPLLAPDESQRGDGHHMNSFEANTRSRSVNEPANLRDGAVSATPTPSFASNPFPATKLYDPFDGSPLGIIAPVRREGEDMSASANGSSNEELWSHLTRVLDLQNQIARMHVDMEGVGLGKQAEGKGKGPLGNSSRTSGFIRPRTMSTSSVPGGDIGDEEGVGVVDEEAEKLKAREREFKKLATQFEGRKEAINDMMNKVSLLTEVNKRHVTMFIFLARRPFPNPHRISLSSSSKNRVSQFFQK
jgi:archaellum component FlaC